MAGSWWHPVRVCWINETQAPYQWFLTLVTHLITCSIQFSRSVMSNSLQPHGLQYTRLPCPLKLMSIESVMPSNHLIFCRPFLLLPSIFPSIRVFSSESVLCIRWPKYWSFSFSITVFRTDFFYNWLVWSPCSPGELSRVFTNTTIQKHQFFSAQLSL